MNTGRLCAVCNAATTQICGGCSDVYYCTEEHQKQHWNTHKLICKPYKICSNPQLGRHMVASRNLKAGEEIFREKAAVTGPEYGSNPVCLSCYAVIKKRNACHCPGCNFPFCSQKCTKSPVHVEECKVLSRAKLRFTSAHYGKKHPAYDCILPLRCLLLKENHPEDYEPFRKLETHTEKRRDGDLWIQTENKVVNFLRQSCRMEQRFTEEEIHEACGFLSIHAFECYSCCCPIDGIFPVAASHLAHNCIANVDYRIDNQFWMIARATVPVKRGEILFISYTDPNQGTDKRQMILRDSKFIECNCTRCCDPTECQTYLSALKCQQCSEGNVLSMKPLDHCSDWKCDHCSHRLTYFEVMMIIFKLEFEYKTIDHDDDEAIESFLESNTSLLHPNHYVFTKARRSLNKLYGSDPLFIGDLSLDLLQRKIDICRELLSIDDVLQPGLTCTRGNILNQMLRPIIMLGNVRYETKAISQEEYKERMLQARDIREEAIRILSLQPADSTEADAAECCLMLQDTEDGSSEQRIILMYQQYVKFN